jgi:putative acetyltransferase
VSFVIRLATEKDSPGICETHIRAIRELCAKDYTSEQLEAWAGPRKPADYLGPIRSKRLCVAEESGRVIGFGQYYEVNEEICAIYVHPDFVR